MIFIKQIKAKVHKWKQRSRNRKRRRDFDGLSPTWQKILKFAGNDPDTLEARELEEEGAK